MIWPSGTTTKDIQQRNAWSYGTSGLDLMEFHYAATTGAIYTLAGDTSTNQIYISRLDSDFNQVWSRRTGYIPTYR